MKPKTKQAKSDMPQLTPAQKKRIIDEFGHIASKEEVFEKIMASQKKMMEALEGAFNTMPDDPKLREEFTEALEKAGELDIGIKQLLNDDQDKDR